MKILWVNLDGKSFSLEELPAERRLMGGSALIAKIMTEKVSPQVDPLAPENPLIVACGPLAGTRAPQLGRLSIGAKSPLTCGIKESNSGGPAGQIMDRLGLRAIVCQGKSDAPVGIYLGKDRVEFFDARDLWGKKTYDTVSLIQNRFGKRVAVICTGIAGERGYRGASISITDIFGDPSRNAARGGLGAVMGAKGLKAIVLDPQGADQVPIAHPDRFRACVQKWIEIFKHDVSCSLFSRFGTPFAINNSASQGTLPTKNYRAGRPTYYTAVSGHTIQKILFERGGKMHGCMPGCVVQCSIIYPDEKGEKICAAYEYETIALLGTNLGILDNDTIARLKFICDDLGLDAIDTGSALGLAAEKGLMSWGDGEGAVRLLSEIEQATPLGEALGNGVVATARFLGIERVPAYKGQALPAHDPRAVKGTGLTYFTSPMGADHTAGLTYRIPKSKERQVENSLGAQIRSATCDAMGYCLNALPGGRESIYSYFAELLNARFDLALSPDDVMEIGKETLRDQLSFNEKAEFSKIDPSLPTFVREEALAPTDSVFDVPEEDVKAFWQKLSSYRELEKVWEIRIPPWPEIMFGAGVLRNLGGRVKGLRVKRVFLITDPFLAQSGRVQAVRDVLEKSGIEVVVFSDVAPDPPTDLIDKAGEIYKETGCDGIVGFGGGSSLDTAKTVGLRVSHGGDLREYEGIVGGSGKIKPIFPPTVLIPTTSGTGSEVNPCAVLTDKERDLKFILMSNHFIPKLAVIDPLITSTMPPTLTVESGMDALAHCIEGYVSLATPYHPYYETMAVYGVKLIGRSLVRAYRNGSDIEARTDMCMAAMCGGLAFLKGLGVGHAITHTLGAHYHLPHGRAAMFGLMAFVKINQDKCREQFRDLAFLLNRSDDLVTALTRLYEELEVKLSLKALGIPKSDLKKIAFFTSRDAVNMATDPTTPSEKMIEAVLTEMYE
ncbi:MAG TPA: iron-containing alcohol dehydrogenase [Syntrophales bacterium]|nr:iron-containing alcohol dehydrogenase [Syntrophales bacterium]HOL58982.1 iron-containing alcohol dehydrogenase [Syntrophales bacterium]HPO34740.1 iron-containing alcohol dehydrogenase [Syntrophales bacterium]